MQRARPCFAGQAGHILHVVGSDGTPNCLCRCVAFDPTTALSVLPRVACEAISTAALSSVVFTAAVTAVPLPIVAT